MVGDLRASKYPRQAWQAWLTVCTELSFPEGATITDLDFPDEDWWFGHYKGASGLFPANYVQLDS